jgi:pyrroloquinoline quinone (PQQ) biosynthesis protein C
MATVSLLCIRRRLPLISLHEELLAVTQAGRERLVSTGIVQRALAGTLSLDRYLAFLGQAYHHVRHTVPLMMAVGARLEPQYDWLRKEIFHYLEEEDGHDQWILDDIAEAGGDAEAARSTAPALATDAMVAYAYDVATRRNPVGFFGMVFVLEGTSVSLASRAADQIQAALGLPARAMTYLRSHGELDQQHVQHLAGILDRLTAVADREAVVRCAQVIYKLYGDMFHDLSAVDGQGAVLLRRTG